MNCILVGSPDKVSLSKFVGFLKRHFNKYEIGEMHSLMSEDSIKLYIEDFFRQFSKGIISYYAKRKINIDPLTCLPKIIQERADVIVWFNLYSTEPAVLKDPDGYLNSIIKSWNKYIKSISN